MTAKHFCFLIGQILIIIVFILFVSDFRHKGRMSPLIHKNLSRIILWGYLIPIVFFGYALANMLRLYPLDWLALSVSGIGTGVVARAKIGLSGFHTRAGYYANANNFVTTGIYAWLRHPIYTGIYLFVLAAFTFMGPRLSWSALLLSGLPSLYILIFLGVVAGRETRYLSIQFGTVFDNYRRQVHPFLPLRRYRFPDI